MSTMSKFLYEISGSTGASSLYSQLPNMLPIFVGAPFVLEQHVELPDSDQGGELFLELRHLSAGPMKIEALRAGPDENQLSLDLAAITLNGRYEIYGLEQPKNTIDTGGVFAPLQQQRPASGTPDDTPPPLTVKQYEYLERADQQRTRLLAMGGNGQTLMDNYDQYSDVYTDVLNGSKQLQSDWASNNATAEMMDWTYSALAPENQSTVKVNCHPLTKTFGSQNATYNSESFWQQLRLSVATHDLSKKDGDIYDLAATAVNTFSIQVMTNSGNDKTNINPMYARDIYTMVQKAQPDPMAKTIGAMVTAALRQLVTGKETTQSRELLAQHGYQFTEEELASLRLLIQKPAEKRRISLWQDNFSVPLARSSLVYNLTQQPDGAISAKLRNSTLRIPSLSLATGAWTGATGAIAAQRVQSARFLLGMLEDRLRSAVTRQIRDIGRAMATDAK